MSKKKSKVKIPAKLKRDVLARDNHRCQYPTAKGICGSAHILCVHDKTRTGKHERVRDCITLCQKHHNQTTAEHRHAVSAWRNLVARLKPYGTEQKVLDFSTT